MSEIIYYSDGSTKITGEYARLGGKSFRLADITSVRVQTTQTDRARNVPTFLIVAGSLLMFTVANLQRFFPGDWDGIEPFTYALGMLIALAGLTILIIQTVLKSDYLYIVRIEGIFGSVCPFACEDEAYVRKIADTLRTALRAPSTQSETNAPLLVEARNS